MNSVAISSDNKYLVTGSRNKTANLWDLATGQEIRSFISHSNRTLVAISSDNKYLVMGGNTVKLWDINTGNELRSFIGHSGAVNSFAISNDNKYLVTGSNDKTAKLWDLETGNELRSFIGHSKLVFSVAISSDNKYLVTGSGDKTTKLWDINTGNELRSFIGHSDTVYSIAISSDNKYLVTGSSDNIAKLLDLETGNELRSFIGHSYDVNSVAITSDNKYLVTGSQDGTAKLWDMATGKELRSFIGHSNIVSSIAISSDNKYLVTGSWDKTAKIWDIATGKELCTLISFDDGTWAVTDPQGRFDASNGGDVEGLHWVVNNKPIALAQLKNRYYEPGLLAKIMGFNKEPLRDVATFNNPKLFPELNFSAPLPDSNNFTIKLNERNGGIGKVQVYLNGKEIIADARNPKDLSKAEINVDLNNYLNLLELGKTNLIEVVAYNEEGYLASRRIAQPWNADELLTVRGIKTIPLNDPNKKELEKPELFAIVAGISNYADPKLNLRFAAKDAQDIAKALQLGAKRFFGTEKVHMTLLATVDDVPATLSNDNTFRSALPTKDNFLKAFADIKAQAKPKDVLVVYLAGHGVALAGKGENGDLYCYPTRDATSVSKEDLKDSALLLRTVLTSEELGDLTRLIPAQKQVMILDTCAAAQAKENLIDKRDVESSQIRAMDRCKDRTGVHVLMGCAADQVSYETSQYGQGLLTYALLQGIKGAALRETEYVDINILFQYAAERVPQLANNIGGIQRPFIATPKDARSFDVGRLTADEKKDVPLAIIKPLILRPTFLSKTNIDSLRLSIAVAKQLNDLSYISTRDGAQLVFVDSNELPGAIQVGGSYTVNGDDIQITMALARDGKEYPLNTIEGKKDHLNELIKKIVTTIIVESQQLISQDKMK